MALYRNIHKKHHKLSKIIEPKIKIVSILKDNSMKVVYPLLFQLISLHLQVSRIMFPFFHHLSVVFDLQIHGNSNFYTFFILLCQGGQVVQGHFIKQDVAKSSSVHVVTYDNWIKQFILNRDIHQQLQTLLK